MKFVKVRLNKEVPELLARPLKKTASLAEVDACVREIFAWAGQDPDDTDRDPQAAEDAWNAVAMHLAARLLPCFSSFRKKTGGRPKRDQDASGTSPLSVKDAEWLVQTIDATRAKRKAAGESPTLLNSIKEVKATHKANKIVSIRGATTLERLYFQERDRKRKRATRRLAEALAGVGSRPSPGRLAETLAANKPVLTGGLFALGAGLLDHEKATGTKVSKKK